MTDSNSKPSQQQQTSPTVPPKTPKTDATKSKPAATLRMKGSTVFRHDLFKSDVKPMRRNESFKKGVVKIVELEHSHIFHTCDDRGRQMEYCTPTGGHFHKVKVKYDANGVPVAVECGPPLKYVNKKTPVGSKKRIVEVRWMDLVNDREVRDDHRHVFEYVHSEELSAKRIQQIRASTQAALGAMTGGAKPEVIDNGPSAAEVGLDDGGDD